MTIVTTCVYLSGTRYVSKNVQWKDFITTFSKWLHFNLIMWEAYKDKMSK